MPADPENARGNQDALFKHKPSTSLSADSAPAGDAHALPEEVEMLLGNRPQAEAGGPQLPKWALQVGCWAMVQQQLGPACTQALCKGDVA